MLIKQKRTKKIYPNKSQSFEGKGFLDSLLSTVSNALTSKAVKEVAVNLSKTAATKIGEKAIEKVTDKIFNSHIPKKESVFTPETGILLDKISATKIQRI